MNEDGSINPEILPNSIMLLGSGFPANAALNITISNENTQSFFVDALGNIECTVNINYPPNQNYLNHIYAGGWEDNGDKWIAIGGFDMVIEL